LYDNIYYRCRRSENYRLNEENEVYAELAVEWTDGDEVAAKERFEIVPLIYFGNELLFLCISNQFCGLQ
jgi:hypothetical protein